MFVAPEHMGSSLQCTATHCNTLKHIATHSTTHTATHCNTHSNTHLSYLTTWAPQPKETYTREVLLNMFVAPEPCRHADSVLPWCALPRPRRCPFILRACGSISMLKVKYMWKRHTYIMYERHAYAKMQRDTQKSLLTVWTQTEAQAPE